MTPITHSNHEIERLERELAESREECRRLRELVSNLHTSIKGTINNAPKEEPKLLSPASLAQAWAYWYTARQLDFVLEVSTEALTPKVGDK